MKNNDVDKIRLSKSEKDEINKRTSSIFKRTPFCRVILVLEMTFAAGLHAQPKPAEDLSDYSRYATATQFTEAYPRQEEQDGCFLMAAEKHAYFSYNHGVYAGTGDNGADIYDTSDLDIFHRPLGPPLGACVRNGFQFRRSFKYLDVAVNVETGETSFQWAKPSVDTQVFPRAELQSFLG